MLHIKKKIKDYVSKELSSKFFFIVSEHFKSEDKEKELNDKYILLADYSNDKNVKGQLKENIDQLLQDDIELQNSIKKEPSGARHLR